MKVLLIDDEEDVRRIASLSLRRVGGMEVVEAAGGEPGIVAAETERPDVILLDVLMPGLDGPETLARLKASRAEVARVPVVFLTAATEPDEVGRLRSLGAAGVLAKPFDPMTLPARLRETLGG